MAELVQKELDEMIVPLLDLKERQIFSDDEIKLIVARRRDSEYKLRRRNPSRADFLAYIQDEINLEQLRQLRTKRIKKALAVTGGEKNTNNKYKKGSGDTHVTRHIHRLFDRLIRKWGNDDVSLHLQHAEFCKKQQANNPGAQNNRLSKVYATALRLHPKCTELWLDAASHEYFVNNSISNARVLLQRGLRIISGNSNSAQQLWIQSFALELHFAQKLKGRKQVLLQGKDNCDGDNDGDDDGYDLARVVYGHAIKAIPDKVGFRLGFLEQCRMFSQTRKLQDRIASDMRRDFASTSPDAWIALAADAGNKRSNVGPKDEEEVGDDDVGGGGDDDDDDEPATKRLRRNPIDSGDDDGDDEFERGPAFLQVLRHAVKALPTSEMFLRTIDFVNDRIDDTNEEGGDEQDEEEEDSVLLDRQRNNESCLTFLDELFEEATSESSSKNESVIYSPSVALEHIRHLVHRRNDPARAIQVLEGYLRKVKSSSWSSDETDNRESEATLSLWTNWAALVLRFELDARQAIQILEKALKRIPINTVGHLILLLQLVGCHIEASCPENNDDREDASLGSEASASVAGLMTGLLERILVLYPGFVEMEEVRDAPFGIRSVPQACLECLLFMRKLQGLDGARAVLRTVLFQSNFSSLAVSSDPEALKLFFDEAIEAEDASLDAVFDSMRSGSENSNLLTLYDLAVRTFKKHNELEYSYRRKWDEYNMRGGNSSATELRQMGSFPRRTVPSFDFEASNFSPGAFKKAFEVFQVVHLRKIATQKREHSGVRQGSLTWKDIGRIFQGLGTQDQESWCVETMGGGEISSDDFLKPKTTDQRAYCSFLIQKDSSAFEDVLRRLPVSALPWTDWFYEPALWIFFGRNPRGSPEMEGRPEHTDAVTHDGTWHYQLSGKKVWHLRPSSSLLRHLAQYVSAANRREWTENTRLSVDCREGDVVVVNTKLWLHQTIVPPQKRPSVSYARDFCLELKSIADKETGGMTNLDGLYATNDIESETVLFRESEMPNCELHRSANPNCEVVELEDGTSAVVSTRKIASGEFFCVAESDDDGGDVDGDGDGESDMEEEECE